MSPLPIIEKKHDRLRTTVLSDFLNAELRGNPIDWTRYCADHARRRPTLEKVYTERLIQHVNGNRWVLTFNGLLLLRSRAAGQVLADCQRIYSVVRAHYKMHLNQLVAIQKIAQQTKPPMASERAVLAVTMLSRESGAGFGGCAPPITEDTLVTGSQSFLDLTFRNRVRERRQLLAKPKVDARSVENQINLALARTSTSNADMFGLSISEFGSQEVRDAWSKCVDRSPHDLDGSITAARSLVESACKQVLIDRGIEFSQAATLPELYAQVKQVTSLDPSTGTDRALKSILQGCATVVSGLAELRNTFGDSHGKHPGAAKPARRHARLAVALAGAMADFILATDEGRRAP